MENLYENGKFLDGFQKQTLLCLLHCICAADTAREHFVRGSSPLFPLYSPFCGAAIIHQPAVTGPQEKK